MTRPPGSGTAGATSWSPGNSSHSKAHQPPRTPSVDTGYPDRQIKRQGTNPQAAVKDDPGRDRAQTLSNVPTGFCLEMFAGARGYGSSSWRYRPSVRAASMKYWTIS